MTFITALLSKLNWGAIVGIFAGIAGVVFGLFRNQQAKTATAEAKRAVAEKTAAVEKGNAAASLAATKAVSAATQAANEVSRIPDSELDKEGASLGILRKD